MIDTHKPEVRYPGENQHFNWTMGGIAQYRAEIELFAENGYEVTSFEVTSYQGEKLAVTALFRLGKLVKVYLL